MKPLWWFPVALCFVAGVIFLLPGGGSGPNLLPYDTLVPLAPISSILIWLVGWMVYTLGRWATGRPMRPQ